MSWLKEILQEVIEDFKAYLEFAKSKVHWLLIGILLLGIYLVSNWAYHTFKGVI